MHHTLTFRLIAKLIACFNNAHTSLTKACTINSSTCIFLRDFCLGAGKYPAQEVTKNTNLSVENILIKQST